MAGATKDTPAGVKESIPIDQIESLYRRAWGAQAGIESLLELHGGEINSTYRLHGSEGDTVILRVAPREDSSLAWHERFLMRREHAIQPWFAPLGRLMPRTLAIDFTHELIDRDYMFQSFMHGERWSDIGDDLRPEEDQALWRELGALMRRINSVRGPAFGHPHPFPQFATWGLMVISALERAVNDLAVLGQCQPEGQALLAAVRRHVSILDAVREPRLLHGDLWPVNVLIERSAGNPRISAVLDADRSWWGDPMAEWTTDLFSRRTGERFDRARAAFWDAYGPVEETEQARLRARLYQGMQAAMAIPSVVRRGLAADVQRAREMLVDVVSDLETLA